MKMTKIVITFPRAITLARPGSVMIWHGTCLPELHHEPPGQILGRHVRGTQGVKLPCGGVHRFIQVWEELGFGPKQKPGGK